MRSLALLALLTGCYPRATRPDALATAPACVTPKGMRFTWLAPSSSSCTYAATAVSNGRNAYQQKAHVSQPDAFFDGWAVTTSKEFDPKASAQGGFVIQEPWGAITAYGATYCEQKLIVVDGPSFRYGSFFHELGHLLDCPRKNALHEGWEVDGHVAAIDLAQSVSP